MDEKTTSFLKKVYKEYYFKNSQQIEFPAKIQEREFGYIPFGGGMVRHLTFKTTGALEAELIRQAPSSVYCSNATYSDPSLPMDEKGWKGAELIFDIDADSIPSACKARHNRSYCQNCNRSGRLPRPNECPKCHSSNTTELSWVCNECLELVKEHAYRLIDFLSKDFGVAPSNVKVYFSGNRGYHIHVYDTRFESFDTQARAEIANYVRGIGINVQKYLARGYAATHRDGFGWEGRINKALSSIERGRGVSKRLFNDAVERNSALIDQSVTTDIHRIFRMAGTLHGSSGMLKKRVEVLESFNPQVDPVVLGDEEVEIFVNFCPKFEMKGSNFGPHNAETVKIPTYAAVYLMAKGLARA
ncbi:MAG: DNA primase small subunit PriS [Thaumarchaeota archaeon]|nr:DNA primase small subunit PriS [Nitrososphaerota archaeon]